MFPDGTEGFHHSAMFYNDYSSVRDKWIAVGYSIASEFTTGFGAQICYVDARATHGQMIELYPESEIIRAMYRAAQKAAENWAGQKLIVPWSRYE